MNFEKVKSMSNLIAKYLILLSAFIVFFIGISSIFVDGYFETTFHHPAEKTFFKFSPGLLELLISTIFLTLLYWINKKIINKIPNIVLILILIIASLGLYIYWINAVQIMPSNDQLVIYEIVQSFLNGTIDKYYDISQYLFYYPYQLGISLIIALFFKIFGTNYLVFEYVNAVCSVINFVLLYLIYKNVFGNKNEIDKLLIEFFFGFTLYFMFFNVHFYGNILGLTLALIAVLTYVLFTKNHNFLWAILSGISIALSIIAKSNYDIFLIGLIIMFILEIINNISKKTILSFLAFILAIITINTSYNLFTRYTLNITPSNDGIPMISFIYMAMAEETDKSPGWYTGDQVKLYEKNSFDTQKTIDESKELIKNRMIYFITHPGYMINYYTQKIASTWLNPTFQTIWCSLPGQRYINDAEYAHYISYHGTALSMVGGKLKIAEEEYFNIYQAITFTFAGIGLYFSAKKNDYKQLILPLIFLGGFAFHILWETKAIYVIQYYFLLLPLSCIGLNESYILITNKLNTHKNKRRS